MTRKLTIHHTPNQNGLPQYTVIRDDGLRVVPETVATNDPLAIIKEVARFLADREGGEVTAEEGKCCTK
ncbi:MAG: hypothetical protein ACYDG4_13375 [Desulfuromonadaceae bacterium]